MCDAVMHLAGVAPDGQTHHAPCLVQHSRVQQLVQLAGINPELNNGYTL